MRPCVRTIRVYEGGNSPKHHETRYPDPREERALCEPSISVVACWTTLTLMCRRCIPPRFGRMQASLAASLHAERLLRLALEWTSGRQLVCTSSLNQVRVLWSCRVDSKSRPKPTSGSHLLVGK